MLCLFADVTGEMSHVSVLPRNCCSFHLHLPFQHEVLACVAKGIFVVLLNHSNSERGYLAKGLQPRLQEIMTKLGKDYTICTSRRDRDPLETW